MTSEAWLLLACVVLGLVDLAAIVIGWLADRHLAHTAHHRKEG
ncbi:hypothetical protein ABZS83_32900 [Streptomyces sp. NPDC005426]